MHSAAETSLDEGYQLRLPTFEGPLDVLLRLIEREQLAISDVSLVVVTQQFILHIASLATDDPLVIADFSTVASRLLVLKSRALLPRPPSAEEETIGDLAEELIARRDVQRAAHHLQRRHLSGLTTFCRDGEAGHGRERLAPPRLAGHAPSQLVAALRRRLSVGAPIATTISVRRMVPIGELIERTLRLFGAGRTVHFADVARLCRDAEEVRASFLAVLVLTRRHVIEARQPVLFGPIELLRVAEGPTNEVLSAAIDHLAEQGSPA